MPLFTSSTALTLLVVTENEVFRADGSPGTPATIKSFHRAQRPPRTQVDAAVELAISLGETKPAQRTAVLAEDFWTGVIDLDERTIHGLQGDDLVQMLRFETESLSGLDPMTSHLGIAELSPVPPDTRRFWGLGVSSEVLDRIATTVSLRGGKLAHLAHPIGMASPLAAGQAWVEFHPNLAGAFAGSRQGFPRAAITSRSKTSERWYKSLESSFGGELPQAGWAFAAAEAPPVYAGALESLGNDEALRRWLIGAATRLTKHEAVPVVAPPVPPTSTLRLAQVGVAAAAVMAVACGLHFASVSWTRAALREEIVSLEQPAEEQREFQKALKALEKEVGEIEAELATLKTQQSDLAAVTNRADRFSELLRAVAAGWSEDMVIDRIEANSDGLQLTGRTISSNAAGALAQRLAPEVATLGWQVEAPELEGDNQMTTGGPWKFQIDLVDISLPPEGEATPPDAELVAAGQ